MDTNKWYICFEDKLENKNMEDLTSKLAASEQREQDLLLRLEQITDFLENGSLPLHWVNSEGIIIWANKAELDFLGYTSEEYLGYHIQDFHEDKIIISDILTRLTNNETLKNYSAKLKTKDGSIKHVLINSSVYTKNGEFIHTRCFTRDITELKEEEARKEALLQELEAKNQALHESEERFRAVANSAPVLLWLSTAEKGHYFFNKKWLDFTGKSFEEESGEGWKKGIHPEDKQHFQDIFSQAFDKRKAFYTEYRLKRHDETYRWISDNGVPRFTPDGQFSGFVGCCLDIEDQKNFEKELENQVKTRTEELKKLNELLVSKNSQLQLNNEELTSFSYAASHDLQAPLRKISTFSTFILDKDAANLSGNSLLYLQRIIAATERMQSLIDSLLNYSRTNSDENFFEKTDLNPIYKEVVANMNDLLEEKHVQIETTTLPVLDVIPLQIQQLFVNLISNSVKYSRPDVQPHIRITSSLVPGNDPAIPEGNPALNYWKISFADNGIGFDQQYEHKIFELFHRLHGKNEYEGTGVGLGIVKKIVLKHNGFIHASGTPGEGAVFDIYIPEKLADLHILP